MTDFTEISSIEDLLKNQKKVRLTEVLREFGIMGFIAYIGGVILIFLFPIQSDFGKQVLFSVTGLFLLLLATLISYSRIITQSVKDKAMIEMTQNACNRLAEQLGKGLTERQVNGITQKIRQLQRDLLSVVFHIPSKS